MKLYHFIGLTLLFFGACASNNKANEAADTAQTTDSTAAAEVIPTIPRPAFNADTAYSFVKELVDFGPRVPNTSAHVKSGDWLVKKLKEFGFSVTEQKADLEAFDGTTLKARNIFAQINPKDSVRTLLIAHWDSRPWADKDPDPEKREEPVLGANDGASGIGVILEIARQLQLQQSTAGVDILFIDAEDWGSYDKEDSWALGTSYFVKNPIIADYKPTQSILLDMVGSPDAKFAFEYFSKQANYDLLMELWDNAQALGYGNYFVKENGGMLTDDHVVLNEAGIPTIDIVDYRPINEFNGSFDPVWHTTADDMRNISPKTLAAVGETVMTVIKPSESAPAEDVAAAPANDAEQPKASKKKSKRKKNKE